MSKKKIGKHGQWKIDRGRESERSMLAARQNSNSGRSNATHILAMRARSRRSG